MAITITNRGLELLGSENAATLDLRVAAFVGTVPAVGTIRDWNVLTDVTTTEAAVAGYSRQDVTGVSYTENDTTDLCEWRGDAMVLTNVAAGETWTHVVWYFEGGGTDGTREVIAVDEPASTLVTNGGNVTLPAFVVNVQQQ